MATHDIAAPQGFIRKYIFSLDHKVIGLQYFFLALVAVFTGMFLSLLMRIHLVWPNASLPFFGEIKPETYLSLLTMHGTIMVFFVLTTAPQGGFGNYFLPIQIGAPDMAFPVLNMLSFWTTFLGFIVLVAAFFVTGGAPLHGWTGYAPLSALQSAGPGEGLGADLWITSIAIFCIGALMGALNFITTTLDMRAKGMTLMRMPLTCWAWFITAILGLLAFGVPSAIKTFNWLGTLWRGKIRFSSPMLFAIGFVSLFVVGGISGPFLAQPVLDIFLHETYFVIAHFHLIMGVASIFGIFAATYYWFPKMFGRMMNETLAKAHFWLTFIGAYAIFMPMPYYGMAGGLRRYSQGTEVAWINNLAPIQKFISIAAFVTIASQLIFLVNLFWSMKKGEKAADNPWEATTLEWTTATPPPHDNFGGVTPVVHNGPYEYSVPGAPRDFVMQTDALVLAKH